MEPVCLEPVCVEPVCLDFVCLKPVCLDRACVDPVYLDFVFRTLSIWTLSPSAACLSGLLAVLGTGPWPVCLGLVQHL